VDVYKVYNTHQHFVGELGQAKDSGKYKYLYIRENYSLDSTEDGTKYCRMAREGVTSQSRLSVPYTGE
jgi:hypothetical protein